MKNLKLKAGNLTVTVSALDGGAVMSSIFDKKTNRAFLSHSSKLFTLKARSLNSDGTVSVVSDEGWRTVSLVQTASGGVITLSDNVSLPNVTVTLTALCGDDKIVWSTSLCTNNGEYSLFECDYVNLSFNCDKNTLFFLPYGCGTVHASDKDEFTQTENYPSYGVAMEYMCFYNKKARRGIYYGLHDKAPAYKKLTDVRVKGDAYMTLKATQPLADIDKAGNSQSLCGSTVWQLFDGDWYDAALLYRDFVVNEAAWMPSALKDGCRSDTPDWMVSNSHWWRIRMKEDDSVVDTLLEAQEILGVPSSVHLYDWHKNPYDNDYPHYFPVKDAMPTVVRRLQEHGMRVMPYINGRLWDTHDRGNEDWQWSTVGKPGCTKNRDGEPFIETYNAVESDGNKVRNSIMCPSTAVWQEKVTENVKKLMYDYDVDGVYIDQIGAAAPYLCEDKTHSHRPGGGTWWCESYRNLLDHVNKAVPQRKIITTECNADPFTRSLDGYLTWLWVRDSQVPAYPVVYAGLVSMFGRHFDTVPADDGDGQKIIFTEQLMFGDQMGWINPVVFLGMPYRDYYVQCVRTRYALAEFYWRGSMCRPPEISDDGDILFTDKDKETPEHILKHQATFAACWERHDGAKAYIFANACGKKVRAVIKADIADGAYKLNNGKTLTFRNGKAVTHLDATSAVYFTIGDKA